MTDITPPIPAPAEPSKGMGLFARIVGVFVSPRATFADVAARPRALGVLVIVLAVVVLRHLRAAVDRGRAAGVARPASAAAWSRSVKRFRTSSTSGMERIAPYVGYIAAASYVIVIPIVLAIIAGILLGVFNALLGGDASFKQVFAIVAHSGRHRRAADGLRHAARLRTGDAVEPDDPWRVRPVPRREDVLWRACWARSTCFRSGGSWCSRSVSVCSTNGARVRSPRRC